MSRSAHQPGVNDTTKDVAIGISGEDDWVLSRRRRGLQERRDGRRLAVGHPLVDPRGGRVQDPVGATGVDRVGAAAKSRDGARWVLHGGQVQDGALVSSDGWSNKG